MNTDCAPRSARRGVVAWGLTFLVQAGCATSLASGHAPFVLEQGRFEVGTAAGASVPVGLVTRLLVQGTSAAKQIASGARGPSGVEVDRATATDAAIAVAALAATPPSIVHDFTVRYGLTDRIELGLRVGGPAVRLESHTQFVRDGSWGVLGGLAVARHSFGGAGLDLLDQLQLASFSRTDFEAVFVAGRDWAYGSVIIGPKFIWTQYGGDGLLVDGQRVVVPGAAGTTTELLSLGNGSFQGGFIGARVGWRYLWLTAELGAYHASFRPRILDVPRDLSGLVISPQLGLVVRWP